MRLSCGFRISVWLSGAGICHGGSCYFEWWCTECGYCTGTDQLAKVFQNRQKPDPFHKGTALYSGVKTGGKYCGSDDFRHVLPNIIGPVLVTSMLDIGTMMMEIAGLSFLGLGAQPPVAEWGSMMSSGRSMLQTYPWIVLSPGAAIFVSVVIFTCSVIRSVITWIPETAVPGRYNIEKGV